MADVKEEDEALKSNSSPKEDAVQIILTPATVSSTSIMVVEETVVGPGSTDNKEEPVRVQDEGNAMVEALKIDEELNKDKALTEGEKDEAQAVREDVIIGKDEEKIQEQINGENLGESSKRKRRKPRKRNKKNKPQEASETVAMDGDKVNAMVEANNGLAIHEEHKEKAIGEEGTWKEDAFKEASIEGNNAEKTKRLKIDEGSNREKVLTEGEKDGVKTQQQITGENLGENLKGKKRKPRKRNNKKKLAEKASEIVANATVAANSGLIVDEEHNKEKAPEMVAKSTVAANNGLIADEEHNKEKAIGEEETHKEDTVKEVSIKRQDEQKTEENKDEERLEESSKGKGRRPRKRNKKKRVAQQALEMVAVDGDKPESSTKKKAAKTIESAGMIFMCSSKTKADCFRYKILGLPAGKKDQVAKIYKGMKLFLFDVDLRLMYGIFKAAGAGGYNIEPKAFKSAFPSQVRFTVTKDCLPLPEEKFRIAIKENYYTRNKFECQLNTQQVKNLCKLFHVAGKSNPSPKKAVKNRQNGREDTSAGKDRKKRKWRARKDETEPHPRLSNRRPHHDYGQGGRVVQVAQAPVISDRAHPGPRYLPVLDSGPVRSYGYQRTYSYAQDLVPDRGSYRVLDARESRYNVYGREAEAPIYRDTMYPSLEYHQPTESRFLSREYHPPTAVQPAEYHLSGGLQLSSYRSEYRPYGTRYGY